MEKTTNKSGRSNMKLALMTLVFTSLMTLVGVAHAQETVCAVVKIEIQQELTLERQAFDAQMKINNALDDMSLEDVEVQVQFEDEDGNPVLASSNPNDSSALFFIRISNLENINDVTGNGTIAPGATAIANWLIIPAPGSATDPSGTIYFVGATLSYTLGGEEGTITVAPDRIAVKPLPRLTLDYFLEREVIADDAFTAEIEPPQPFTLGVRVQNNGQATAPNVQIDSAQPKIIENEQGLAIGFEIINSFVGNQPVSPSLLLNFGDVPANEAKMGRWQMVTTLSGEFTEFTAEFTHADELGGELTSLLEATNTHFLIRDVLVDLPGRDAVLDFLADDGDALRVYESNTVDTVVNDVSASGTLGFTQNVGLLEQYALNIQNTAGFVYAKLPDTVGFGNTKIVNRVLRSDGKVLPLANAWFSQERNESNGFDYFLNIFDVNTTGQYTVLLENKIEQPFAPALQFIPDRQVLEGQPLSFIVEASDPNGTIPEISVEQLPTGATFVLDNTDNNVATYIFSWTPATSIPGPGQAGTYELNFIASDGQLSSNRRANVVVLFNNDTDGDGMDDQWELDNFGTLDRDGTGDFDNDGVSDLDEYLNGTNPTAGPSTGPSTPVIVSPLFGSRVDSLQPSLEIENSTITPVVPLSYEFELYADEAMTQLVTSEFIEEQTPPNTAWLVPVSLTENAHYSWRARAYDGVLYSEWVNGQFMVDATAEAPGAFFVNNPSDGSEVSSFLPILQVNNSTDPDEDPLVYVFEIFADQSLTTPVLTSPDIVEQAGGVTSWQVTTALQENTLYYWSVTAKDDDDLTAVSDIASFFVNTANEAPTTPNIVAPVDASVVTSTSVDLSVSEASDADNDSLLYEFELDLVDTFDSAALELSGQVSNTQFTVENLLEDAVYYWRARAGDGFATSAWVTGSFRVNANNVAPPVPTLDNPGDGSWVATLLPTFSVNAVTDSDGDSVTYEYEIYSEAALVTLIDSATEQGLNWQPTTELLDNTWYFWRARTKDEAGEFSAWATQAMFFVNSDNYDDEPVFNFVQPSAAVTVSSGSLQIQWNDADPDSSAEIALYYDNDTSGEDGILIVEGLLEDNDGAGDAYAWNTSAIANGDYYVYAVVTDAASSITVYNPALITIENSTENQAPTITLTAPANSGYVAVGDAVQITWTASDIDNDAQISLYYSDAHSAFSALIVSGLSEDNVSTYSWDTSAIGEGTWYIYATISDGLHAEVTSFATGSVTTTLGSIVGTTGDDEILGTTNNDVIDGGEGDDYLDGGEGADIYHFELNEGNDSIWAFDSTIADADRNDIVRFGTGILPPDVAVTIDQSDVDDLVIVVNSTGQEITILNYFVKHEGLYRYQIGYIEFADGTVWDRTQINSQMLTAIPADGDDTMIATGSENAVLNGGYGNDYLEGAYGDDILTGGLGNDILYGDEGDDVYIINYGDGNDIVDAYDYSPNESRADVIRFGAGINPEDVVLTHDTNDMFIYVPGTGQRIEVNNNFKSWSGDYRAQIGFIEFSDGTLWDRTQIEAILLSYTDGDDTILGFNGKEDVLNGGLGNDSLNGYSQNDVLNGGLGDDVLYGGEGVDIFIINHGEGNDIVDAYDSSANEQRADVIRLGPGIAPEDVLLSHDTNDMFISIMTTGQQIQVNNNFKLWGEDYRAQIGFIEFADGTIWDRAQIDTTLLSYTDGDDTILGFNAKEDVLNGGAGNDHLNGYSRDDVLNGGAGDDYLYGGEGDDIYIINYGEGNDIVDAFDYTPYDLRADVIQFGSGISPADIQLSRDDKDLILTNLNNGQSTEVNNHFMSWSGEQRAQIGFIEFEDGTVWDRAYIDSQIPVSP